MKLLIIRHGKALTREEFARTGRPDSERPLTDEGKEKFERGVIGLRTILPKIDRLVSSPYRRALETAEILSRGYDNLKIEKATELRSDAPLKDRMRFLTSTETAPVGLVAVVGHEPSLSEWVGYLTAEVERPIVNLKKGGAILLEIAESPGRLLWALEPSQLRKLGE